MSLKKNYSFVPLNFTRNFILIKISYHLPDWINILTELGIDCIERNYNYILCEDNFMISFNSWRVGVLFETVWMRFHWTLRRFVFYMVVVKSTLCVNLNSIFQFRKCWVFYLYHQWYHGIVMENGVHTSQGSSEWTDGICVSFQTYFFACDLRKNYILPVWFRPKCTIQVNYSILHGRSVN